MSEQRLRLADGTAVRLHAEGTTSDWTSTGGWLAELLCAAAPSRPDRIEVTFGPADADGAAPVTVTLAWDRAPEAPSAAPARLVTDQPPGRVLPTQRPGAAPPGRGAPKNGGPSG